MCAKVLLGLGSALTALLVSSCVLPSSTHSAGSSGASAPAPAGSTVRDGKFEFRVLDVTRTPTAGDPSNPYEIVKAQGEFVILTLSEVKSATNHNPTSATTKS
jgi:hypothetical protein